MKLKMFNTAALSILLMTASACSIFITVPPTATTPGLHLTVAVPTQTNSVLQLEAATPTTQEPTLEQATATVEELVTETETPWPTVASQPAAPAQLPSGTKIQLDEIHMVNQGDGWGISGGLLLKTADGGRTWREITPATGQADRVYAVFLDAQTAWMVFSMGGQVDNPLTIYHTTDGGITWTYNQGPPIYTQVVGDTTWAEFATLNAQNIWMLVRGVYVGAGTHYNHELFHSTDGGITWISQDGEISDDYTGMVFADENFGLRTLQTIGFYGPGAPTYDVTIDGGTTWVNRELPPPPGAPNLFIDYPYCESYQPILLSTQSIHMLVGCFDYSDPPTQFTSYLYTTQDGGTTWTMVHLPAKVLASQSSLFYFDVQNALLLGKNMYKSTDGGQTWIYVQTVSWQAQLTFVDPLHGWATGGLPGEKALVSTIDGGKKWVLVKPTIAP
jgi:photosystem II stability/assembly factor-like uncharacterized protein